MKDWTILNETLLDVFGGNAVELRAFVRAYPHYPEKNRRDLVFGLPGVESPVVAFFGAATDQIKAHGLDDRTFFEELAELRPMKRDGIRTAARRYLGEVADEGAVPLEPSDLDATASPEELANFERAMADRPTFLDVWYLSEGVERARSVAKLRMKLNGIWYTGTAFLIAPDRLMTVRHNFYEKGTRAEKVEVLFDYFRSFDGKESEGVRVEIDLDSIESGTEGDWAVARLRAPLERPTLTFAAKPAAVDDRVSVLQHPSGDPMQVALHNNLVTLANDDVLQYMTDTKEGSSGSPVFNQRWEVVALHRGWVEIEENRRKLYRNEGTALAKLREVLAGISENG